MWINSNFVSKFLLESNSLIYYDFSKSFFLFVVLTLFCNFQSQATVTIIENDNAAGIFEFNYTGNVILMVSCDIFSFNVF